MGDLRLSVLAAALPLIVLLILLGISRKPAWVASLIGLGTAFFVAVSIYRMPWTFAVSSAAYGAAYGLFPSVGSFSRRFCSTE